MSFRAVNGGSIAVINLKQKYGIKPGDDITATLTAAYAYAVANCPNGADLVIEDPGVYHINGASQTGTAQGYSYAGQVLIPAVALASSMPIRLMGAVPPSSGGSTTGAPTGIVLQSNATSGYVFDIIPSFTEFGCPWTGVMPIFENLVIRCPDNPTCGGLNMLCTQRFKLDRVTIDTPTSAAPTSGSLEALVLPQIYNNGDITVRDLNLRGYPVGVRLSEHNVLDNVFISFCKTAFVGGGASHANWFGYVDVEECATIFDGGVAPAFGSPAPSAGTIVFGSLDYENNQSTGTFTPIAFVNDTSTNPVKGKLDLYGTVTGTYPIVGGRALDLVPVRITASQAPNQRATGWMESFPYDTFDRLISTTGSGSPGQCAPSLHPWRLEAGGFVAGSKVLQGTTGADKCFVPVPRAANYSKQQGSAPSRTLTMTVTLGNTSPLLYLISNAAWNGSGSVLGGANGIAVRIAGGSQVSLRANNTGIVSGGGNLAAGSTHTVQLAVYHGADGYPYRAKVYVDLVLVIDQPIPTASKSLGNANPSAYPYYEDGIWLADTGSIVSLFTVQPITPEPAITTTSAITYSASMTPDATQGVYQTITVTNANAMTINAPSGPPVATQTQDLTIEVYNNSGGAMGVITWNAAFVFAGATWTNPANGKKRAADFRWNGAAWRCMGVSAADY